MADILAALDQLEREDRSKKPTNTKFINPLKTQPPRSGRSARPRSLSTTTPQNRSQSQSRPQSQPANKSETHLSPTATGRSDGFAGGERSPSVASNRRISFADPPRPPPVQRRVRVPTKKSSLASGFPFDPKLVKYSVSEAEWQDFSDAVVDAANMPKGASWAWSFHKKDVVQKVKKELQYEGGDFKRLLNAWNRNFRRKGFTVSLELPGNPKIHDEDTEEEKRQEREDAKRFRLVLTPNAEKGGSVYSRSSSLTRSVTNEAAGVQHKDQSPVGSDVEDDMEDDTESDKEVDNENGKENVRDSEDERH